MRSSTSAAVAFALFATMLVSCGDVGDAPEATTGEAVTVSEGAGGSFAIDTSRSSIAWKAAKVTNAHDGGFNKFEGTVSASGDSITAVRVTIHTTSIFSDNEKLTNHLKSDDFFKVDEHPTAKFEADKFRSVDSAGFNHVITGNLTMLGVTKSVIFPAIIEASDSVVTAKGDFII